MKRVVKTITSYRMRRSPTSPLQSVINLQLTKQWPHTNSSKYPLKDTCPTPGNVRDDSRCTDAGTPLPARLEI